MQRGVSRQTLYDVLKEKQPITPGMALRLGKLRGMVPISGSIGKSATVCIRPSGSSVKKINAIPTLVA